ncbi:hypothetical protein PG991_001748 [Apiospora marii]|uniref:Uncharacterized protein n=1 Tax=Apiospora marii TaxID=335849 RepID=A0ABR1SQK1_9PEZI
MDDNWLEHLDLSQVPDFLDLSQAPDFDLPPGQDGVSTFDFDVAGGNFPLADYGTASSTGGPTQDNVIRRLVDIVSRLERIEAAMARKEQIELQTLDMRKGFQNLLYYAGEIKRSIEKLREGLKTYTEGFLQFWGTDADAQLEA